MSQEGLHLSSPLAELLELALAEVDPSGGIVSINSLGRQRWGWDQGGAVSPDLLKALKHHQGNGTKLLSLRPGDLFLLRVVLAPGRGWLLIGYDAEASRTDYESTFKSLIENTEMAVLRLCAAGTVCYAEAGVEHLTGYGAEQIVGQPFLLKIAHPEDRWKLTEALRLVVEGRSAVVNLRFLTARQALRLARLYLLPAAEHAEAEIEVLLFDMTEQAEVEAALLQSEALYRTFLEQSPMGILHLDAAGIVTFENHPFRQIVGEHAEDAWIGRNIADIDGLGEHLKHRIIHMLSDGRPLRGEEAPYRKPGLPAPFFVVMHGSPIREPSGVIVGGVLMIEDVTAERQQEEELRLRTRYEKAEAALREVVLTDLDEAMFLREAARILGETVQGDAVYLLTCLGVDGPCMTSATWARGDAAVPPLAPFTPQDHSDLLTLAEQRQSLHLPADVQRPSSFDLDPQSEVFWCPFYDVSQLAGYALFQRRGGGAGRIGWNDTERRLMERLVLLFETLWSWLQVGQRYRLTVATIDDCLFTFSFTTDQKRRYLFITPQLTALTGYQVEEVLAREGHAFAWSESLVHPEDRAEVAQHDRLLRAGQESRLTHRIQHRDGSVRWICEYARPHTGAMGEVVVSGVLMDVTEQKAAEVMLVSAKEEAESASRLKSAFVATMSHEIRSPLGAINGFAELLDIELAEWEEQEGQALPPQIDEFIEAIRQNAKRLLLLADDLFVLSNMEISHLRLDRAVVSLHPLLKRAIKKVTGTLAEKEIVLHLDLAPEEILVKADSHRLGQLLDNVLDNAAKFTEEGSVSVTTKRRNGEVCVEVRDSGIGMGDEYLDKLFLPFLQEDNRLNRRFEGTGLGLALVKRLVDLMGGRISVESEKGVGSTFSIFLQVAD